MQAGIDYKIQAAIDEAHSAGMIGDAALQTEVACRLDELALELMASRPELKPMSLDEWLIEHMEKLSEAERKNCTAIIDAYFV